MIQKIMAGVRGFFAGMAWPFTRLETRAASAGLVLSALLLIAAGSAAGIGAYAFLPYYSGADTSSTASDATASYRNDSSCNTVGIEIRGCIATYKTDSTDPAATGSCDVTTSSEDVLWKLDEAAKNPNIKALVLQIDSSGGSPVAADEIAKAVKVFGKPSVAWVRESADSAAYWIASAADTIIASENSDVGSIGVTSSYLDNTQQNIKDGLTYNQLTTGKYKDTGSPDRALTADDRSLIQRDLDIILKNFIQAVATNRHLSVEKVTALADGSTMLGAMAKENGLVDELGTKPEVWQKLESDIGEKPEVCWP